MDVMQVSPVDALHAAAVEVFPTVDAPVEHIWTPGLYCRHITMYAGSLIISKIHRTEHPYVISKGVVTVWTPQEGTVLLRAPFTGITKPGTQRVLYIHEDTIWTTFHPRSDDEETVEQIENRIIEPHENPLMKLPPETLESLMLEMRGAA